MPQGLSPGLLRDPEVLHHRALALTLQHQNPPNASTGLRSAYLSGVGQTWLSSQPFVKQGSGGLLFPGHTTCSHGMTRSVFPPAFSPLCSWVQSPANLLVVFKVPGRSDGPTPAGRELPFRYFLAGAVLHL